MVMAKKFSFFVIVLFIHVNKIGLITDNVTAENRQAVSALVNVLREQNTEATDLNAKIASLERQNASLQKLANTLQQQLGQNPKVETLPPPTGQSSTAIDATKTNTTSSTQTIDTKLEFNTEKIKDGLKKEEKIIKKLSDDQKMIDEISKQLEIIKNIIKDFSGQFFLQAIQNMTKAVKIRQKSDKKDQDQLLSGLKKQIEDLSNQITQIKKKLEKINKDVEENMQKINNFQQSTQPQPNWEDLVKQMEELQKTLKILLKERKTKSKLNFEDVFSKISTINKNFSQLKAKINLIQKQLEESQKLNQTSTQSIDRLTNQYQTMFEAQHAATNNYTLITIYPTLQNCLETEQAVLEFFKNNNITKAILREEEEIQRLGES